jgi:hypothetical protein
MRQFCPAKAVGNKTASRIAIRKWSHPKDKCNYNSLHLYARRAPFESRPRHCLSWRFSSVIPKCWDNNFVRVRLPHFEAFPVSHSSAGTIFGQSEDDQTEDQIWPAELLRTFVTNSMELRHSWETASRSATQEFRNIIWIRRITTVFTKAFHWPISWARSIQSISHQFILAILKIRMM